MDNVVFIVAIRTRSNGEWAQSDHYPNMECRGAVCSSLTSVAKDNLLLEVYETKYVEKKTERRREEDEENDWGPRSLFFQADGD